ncbi:MAG: glycosyltransferase family 2 protein [Cyclobacteriaceae bacterium]
MMKLSIVVTVYNEEDNIAPLLENVQQAMHGFAYELIFVDDGSSDQTVKRIKDCADENTRLIILNKNYGQTAAMAAGIDQAVGEYVVTIDGDLQNDPSDIPLMLKKLEDEGWDVVAGIRANRQDSLVIRKVPSKIANGMIRKLTGVHLHDYGCTLKVFKKDVAKNLGLYGELHRFIPVLAQLQGANITEMPVKHHPRIHGQSKYGLGRTFKVMSDLLLMIFFQKYLQKPMHLFGTAGIVTFLAGSAINMYLLVLKIMGEDIWGRPLLILGITLLLGGVQLITIGLLAELIVRTYFETQNKKTYRIREEFRGQPQEVNLS